MYPQNFLAEVMVSTEVFTGVFLLAILTGLMYARFSRPSAKVIFSKVAVVYPFNGISTLMFRVANQRQNQILQARIQLYFLVDETSVEGHQLRRFYDLELLRSQTPAFGLSWLVMHPIDENSPLYGHTQESLSLIHGEIWVILSGLDETSSQTVHSRNYYNYLDILWNRRFVDLISRDKQGEIYMNLELIHDVI